MPSPANPEPTVPKLPAGATDLTEQLGGAVKEALAKKEAGHGGRMLPVDHPVFQREAPPVMPINLNALVSASDAMKGAVNNTYLGNFTEGDAKGHVSRTVQVTQWQDMMMNELAQDSRFGYNGSKAQFIRHAIELLITYYQEKGMTPEEQRGLFGDLLRAGKMLREDAERERIRADFTDNIRAHDRTMETARLTGDWQNIARRLTRYMDAIESCEDEAQRKILRGVFAESIATRTAVTAFNRWINDPGRAPDEHVQGWDDQWPALAEQWREFYQDWGSI